MPLVFGIVQVTTHFNFTILLRVLPFSFGVVMKSLNTSQCSPNTCGAVACNVVMSCGGLVPWCSLAQGGEPVQQSGGGVEHLHLHRRPVDRVQDGDQQAQALAHLPTHPSLENM